jgi:hypothetical protein
MFEEKTSCPTIGDGCKNLGPTTEFPARWASAATPVGLP